MCTTRHRVLREHFRDVNDDTRGWCFDYDYSYYHYYYHHYSLDYYCLHGRPCREHEHRLRDAARRRAAHGSVERFDAPNDDSDGEQAAPALDLCETAKEEGW